MGLPGRSRSLHDIAHHVKAWLKVRWVLSTSPGAAGCDLSSLSLTPRERQCPALSEGWDTTQRHAGKNKVREVTRAPPRRPPPTLPSPRLHFLGKPLGNSKIQSF